MLFPTDLASFLDLIRQHGNAAYSFMFAYAASHSLLLALFAGYAAHSGALSFGTLIVVCWFGSFAGDVIRFWIGRRFGARWLERFHGSNAPSRRSPAGEPSPCLDDPVPSLPERHPRGRRVCLRDVATALVHFPGAQFCRGGPLVLRHRLGRLCLRPGLGEVDKRRFFGPGFVMLLAFLGLSWMLSKKLDQIVERY